MNKRRLLLWVLCLSILMLFCIVPAKAEETEPEAEEITRNYTFAKNNSEINALYTHDGKLVTYNTYGPEDVLHIRPKGDWTMHILFFRFQTQTARMTLQQFDRQGTLLLTLDVDSDSLCCAVTLEEGAVETDLGSLSCTNISADVAMIYITTPYTNLVNANGDAIPTALSIKDNKGSLTPMRQTGTSVSSNGNPIVYMPSQNTNKFPLSFILTVTAEDWAAAAYGT